MRNSLKRVEESPLHSEAGRQQRTVCPRSACRSQTRSDASPTAHGSHSRARSSCPPPLLSACNPTRIDAAPTAHGSHYPPPPSFPRPPRPPRAGPASETAPCPSSHPPPSSTRRPCHAPPQKKATAPCHDPPPGTPPLPHHHPRGADRPPGGRETFGRGNTQSARGPG